MFANSTPGILVVSFGTTHTETCNKTIVAIENEIEKHFPSFAVYRAWTSKKVREIVNKRDNLEVLSISEALKQMHRDGIRKVFIQPTHMLDGIENSIMKEEIERVRNLFEHVAVGEPLLSTPRDIETISKIILDEWNLDDNEVLVYVGHGSNHNANEAYQLINQRLYALGSSKHIIGTMQPAESIHSVLEQLKKFVDCKIVLAPFMIVSGSHAINELAGDRDDSWKYIFEKEGYHVECILKGLGEFPQVRSMFIEHLKKIIY